MKRFPLILVFSYINNFLFFLDEQNYICSVKHSACICSVLWFKLTPLQWGNMSHVNMNRWDLVWRLYLYSQKWSDRTVLSFLLFLEFQILLIFENALYDKSMCVEGQLISPLKSSSWYVNSANFVNGNIPVKPSKGLTTITKTRWIQEVLTDLNII